MKKYILAGIIGFIVGIIVTGVVMYNIAPGMMLLEDESQFGFDETALKLEESVEVHNWKIPHVHDLQKSMKKFGIEVGPVKVFELCHPEHAGKILEKGNERIVSSLMPCRVAIYEKPDGKTYISRMNSNLMAQPMGGIIAEVMSDAATDNEKILEVIIKK
jgi:uncharacterized protein (DUF302 family)